MTTRRDVFKIAAGAAATATAASVPAIVEAAPIAEAAAVLPATPYTDYPWKWFCTYDGEIYYDPFETFEDAMESAKESDYSGVALCQEQDFDLTLHGDWVLEHLCDRNEELMNEDGDFLKCTPEQEKDLTQMLTATIEQWVMKHQISIKAWAFRHVKNETEVSHETTNLWEEELNVSPKL